MDGGNTIDKIAELVQENFTVRFKTQEKAHYYVKALAQQYAHYYVKALAQQYGQLQALNPEVIGADNFYSSISAGARTFIKDGKDRQ
jgi:hypothetical protein